MATCNFMALLPIAIDFYLSPTRSAQAAKRFLAKSLTGLKAWEKPVVINTDRAPTCAAERMELERA